MQRQQDENRLVPQSAQSADDSVKTTAFADRIRSWWNESFFPGNEVGGASDSNASTRIETRGSRLEGSHRFLFGLLVVAAAAILFGNLGYWLFDPDETRNAQLGLNVFESGDWLSLTLSGEPYWDKPPLQAWLTAASYRLFGPSVLATRLPCALASFLTVVATFVLGSRIVGARAGLIGATLLLFSAGFLVVGRYVTMDATLTLCAVVMLLATILGTTARRLKRGWLVLAGVACGLGLLTKGPVVAVLVLPPLLLAGWLERKSFYRQIGFWLSMGVPALLIAAPWFVMMGIEHPDFLAHFFWKHHFVRFTNAFDHQQPWWFYLPVILLMLYPTTLLLPSLIKLLFGSDRQQRKMLGPEFGKLTLFVIWVVLFFSLSDSKLITYILPALPPLCLMLGKMLDLTVCKPEPEIQSGRWLQSTPVRASISVLIVGLVLAGLLINYSESVGVLSLLQICWLPVGMLATVIFIWRAKSSEHRWFATVFSASLLMMMVAFLFIPALAKHRSTYRVVRILSQESEFAHLPIVILGRLPNGHVFALPNSQVVGFEDEHRQEGIVFVAEHPQAVIISNEENLSVLQEALFDKVCIKRHGLHRKLYTCTPKLVSSTIDALAEDEKIAP